MPHLKSRRSGQDLRNHPTVLAAQGHGLQLPSSSIETRAAAEAVIRLYDLFSMNEDLDAWIAELQADWPDLAAMIFTAARDE